jgi:hypothetical protein
MIQNKQKHLLNLFFQLKLENFWTESRQNCSHKQSKICARSTAAPYFDCLASHAHLQKLFCQIKKKKIIFIVIRF